MNKISTFSIKQLQSKIIMPPSKLWKYFTKTDKNSAKCKICAQVIRTSGNTSNLNKHFISKHPNYSSAENKDPCETSSSSHTPKKTKTCNSHDIRLFGSTRSLNEDEIEEQDTTNVSEKSCGEIDISDSETDGGKSVTGSSQSSQKTTQAVATVLVPERKKIANPIEKCYKRTKSFADGGNRHNEITNALVYFVCADNRPFNIIEGRGFKSLMKQIAPLYRVPSRETLKSRIDAKYDVLSAVFIKKLEHVNFISLTTDIWSEMMSCRSFLGITAHFLEERKLESINIDVIELSERHSADYIADMLKTVWQKWGINETKITAIVTDNAPNMISACAKTIGKEKHLPCFAHTINLVAENALKQTAEFNSLLEKIRTIVKHFKKSIIFSDHLRKLQKNKGLSEGKIKKLILDVKTRWNSVYYMLERFVELSNIISEILFMSPAAPPMLTPFEIAGVKEIITLLRPLEHVTRESSGDSYITISKIIPMISCTRMQYNNMEAESPISLSLKSAIDVEMQKRFGSIEQMKAIAVATILDPRFKNLHFQDAQAAANAISFIRKEIAQFQAENVSSSGSESDLEPNTQPTYDFWNHHKNLAHKPKRKAGSEVKDELSIYLSNPTSTLNTDPLILWHEMETVFPLLNKLALKYFSIVATSVPSERLFSKAGATATQERNRLSGKRLKKLLFLNSIQDKYWS